MQESQLIGEIALVTGASRGIGAAIAAQLSNMGFFVVGTATSETGAQNISANLAACTGKGVGMVLALDQTDTIDDFYAQCKKEHGAPSVLVNNAGIVLDQLAMRTAVADFANVLQVNTVGTFALSKLAMRDMMRAKVGRIVNIGSVTGSMGNAGQVAYTASKAALGGMTRTLAKELGARNITVNCVEPGFIATDMTDNLPEDLKSAATATIPLGRFGTPAEVADLVAFLASTQAAYITGETIAINGGLYMK